MAEVGPERALEALARPSPSATDAVTARLGDAAGAGDAAAAAGATPKKEAPEEVGLCWDMSV